LAWLRATGQRSPQGTLLDGVTEIAPYCHPLRASTQRQGGWVTTICSRGWSGRPGDGCRHHRHGNAGRDRATWLVLPKGGRWGVGIRAAPPRPPEGDVTTEGTCVSAAVDKGRSVYLC